MTDKFILSTGKFNEVSSFPISEEIVNEENWYNKSIPKKDLKLFLDILDVTENNIKVIWS